MKRRIALHESTTPSQPGVQLVTVKNHAPVHNGTGVLSSLGVGGPMLSVGRKAPLVGHWRHKPKVERFFAPLNHRLLAQLESSKQPGAKDAVPPTVDTGGDAVSQDWRASLRREQLP